jgi:hypothetical protein
MRDGVALTQITVPAPVAAIAPGQSVRFAHVFPHGLASDVDWSRLRPVLVSIEEAAAPAPVEMGPGRDRGAEQPGGWIVDEAAPPSNIPPDSAPPSNPLPSTVLPENAPPSNVPPASDLRP